MRSRQIKIKMTNRLVRWSFFKKKTYLIDWLIDWLIRCTWCIFRPQKKSFVSRLIIDRYLVDWLSGHFRISIKKTIFGDKNGKENLSLLTRKRKEKRKSFIIWLIDWCEVQHPHHQKNNYSQRYREQKKKITLEEEEDHQTYGCCRFWWWTIFSNKTKNKKTKLKVKKTPSNKTNKITKLKWNRAICKTGWGKLVKNNIGNTLNTLDIDLKWKGKEISFCIIFCVIGLSSFSSQIDNMFSFSIWQMTFFVMMMFRILSFKMKHFFSGPKIWKMETIANRFFFCFAGKIENFVACFSLVTLYSPNRSIRSFRFKNLQTKKIVKF